MLAQTRGARTARPGFLTAILATALIVSSCLADGAHGLSAEQWLDALEAGAELPLAEGARPNYAALSRLGPGALLFLSMHAQNQGRTELRLDFLEEAAKRESGRYKARAAELLADALTGAGLYERLLAFVRSSASDTLEPYRRRFLEALALLETGRPADAAKSLSGLAALATDGETDPLALILELRAGLANPRGGNAWADKAGLLWSLELEPAGYTALATLLEEEAAAPPERRLALAQNDRELLAARVASGLRDYGDAVTRFASLAGGKDAQSLAALVRSLPRASASDAARAFVYGLPDTGNNAWALMAPGDPGLPGAFHAAFWRGRFLRTAGKNTDAAAWFGTAARLATNAADRDASFWYQAESLAASDPLGATGVVATALRSTRNPSYYSDLLEPLSRKAILARRGDVLAALDAATLGRADAWDRARLAYLSARASAVGIIQPAHLSAAFGNDAFASAADYQERRLEEAYDQHSDSWYRLLAGYRLGRPLAEPADGPGWAPPDTAAEAGNEEPAEPGERESAPAIQPAEADNYALALARFGLASRLRSELGAERLGLGADTLRHIAANLARRGNHADAVRTIAPLFSRPSFTPSRQDRELYWPRPWPEHFASSSQDSGLPAELLYGLARSESLFQADVVSSAGAIGLAQLMPATAEETAGRLRLLDYDLYDPADNLKLGSAYLARLLATVDGQVLPALFSYNAGLGRYRRWEASAGRLPADLVLETLEYAETRQYGRNVAGAAAAYAALYGGQDVEEFLAWMLGE
ncbi:MAG: lytic transglycosylase domain-containing protein [Spirochaetales bacterium]|nr:lytic transglycosylase domain-containing protein [Spirochaetales bacterium]